MRKYRNYTLATESEDCEVFGNYRSAFSAFNTTDESATLYGETEEGDTEVIMSK